MSSRDHSSIDPPRVMLERLMSTRIALLERISAVRTQRVRSEAVLARRYAPGFNAVSLLQPGETRLTQVFRWLFDEAGSHGQGGIFRDRFLETILNEPVEPWVGATALTEVATSDGAGRIDLLLRSKDGSRSIVIENKPWAGWQANQLARYLDDQLARCVTVRVHALIGEKDASRALLHHWGDAAHLPSSVTASGFGEISEWLEDCAAAAQPTKVREFILDVADYCRQAVLGEAQVGDINETADFILAGGSDTLLAARSIAAALPLAQTRYVAKRLGGTVEMVGTIPSLSISKAGVPINFVLFERRPWVGVTAEALSQNLKGSLKWDVPERLWPRWTYLSKVSPSGPLLLQALTDVDCPSLGELIDAVSCALLGTSTGSSPPQAMVTQMGDGSRDKIRPD